MSASAKTVRQIADIIIDEVGVERGIKIALRSVTEVRGNASYLETMRRLLEELRGRR